MLALTWPAAAQSMGQRWSAQNTTARHRRAWKVQPISVQILGAQPISVELLVVDLSFPPGRPQVELPVSKQEGYTDNLISSSEIEKLRPVGN